MGEHELDAWGHPGFGAETGPDHSAEQAPIRFGRCLVRPLARSLERDGEIVELGGRAFDLLMILLQSRGRVVTKEEIMRHVWPTTIVEDANLRVQMACLRKALGSDGKLVITIPRRGYMAMAENDFSTPPAAAISTQILGAKRRRSAFLHHDFQRDRYPVPHNRGLHLPSASCSAGQCG